MGCKVILSPRAIQDLREIVRYISLDNPQAAESFGYELIDAALSLADLPERGRFVPEFFDQRTREIIHGRYRIVYRFDAAEDRLGFALLACCTRNSQTVMGIASDLGKYEDFTKFSDSGRRR